MIDNSNTGIMIGKTSTIAEENRNLNFITSHLKKSLPLKMKSQEKFIHLRSLYAQKLGICQIFEDLYDWMKKIARKTNQEKFRYKAHLF